MNIIIKTSHVGLARDVEESIKKKLEGLKRLTGSAESDVRIEMEIAKTSNHHQHGDIYQAAINFNYKGRQHRVSATAEDIHGAVDQAIHDLSQELATYKEKRMTLIRKGRMIIKNMMKGFSRDK